MKRVVYFKSRSEEGTSMFLFGRGDKLTSKISDLKKIPVLIRTQGNLIFDPRNTTVDRIISPFGNVTVEPILYVKVIAINTDNVEETIFTQCLSAYTEMSDLKKRVAWTGKVSNEFELSLQSIEENIVFKIVKSSSEHFRFSEGTLIDFL